MTTPKKCYGLLFETVRFPDHRGIYRARLRENNYAPFIEAIEHVLGEWTLTMWTPFDGKVLAGMNYTLYDNEGYTVKQLVETMAELMVGPHNIGSWDRWEAGVTRPRPW